MVVYTTNISCLPLFLAIWMVDVYLFMVLLRFIMGRVACCNSDSFRAFLQDITDAVPNKVGDWITRQGHQGIPSWVPWVFVVVGAILIRQVLLVLVVLAA